MPVTVGTTDQAVNTYLLRGGGTAMRVSLSALAPLRVIDHQLLDGTGVLTREATTLFVDLVGFTPLTDQLGRFGSRGTEQLSEVLQGFFGTVTDRALAHGGDPIAYGGDALTIVFDGDSAHTVAAARELAGSIHDLSAAATGTATLAGPVSLQTRIGIARGAVTTTVVRANDRSLPIQLGVGLDRAVAAESDAAVGQVVLHASVAPLASSTTAALSGTTGELPPKGAALDPEALARLVHPAVRGHLQADSSLWESHRTATVAFVSFPPVSSDGLADFVRSTAQLMHHVDECGGEVVQVSGGDKGIVALAVFGAPVGHDDDPLRAMQAVLELRRLVPSITVGVTTGPVFTTWLGSEQRRFQAHFGGALNVAARLMQAGQPREVLVDAATWQSVGTHLRQHGGPKQIRVKGQPDPVEVRHVAGWRRRRQRPTSPATPMLAGRESESDLIEELLDQIQANRGRAHTFVGVPGIGKSRLAKEAADRARTRGMAVLELDAEDYPYGQMAGLWRDLLGQRLGIPPSSRRSAWQAALREGLPGQATRLDVLGPVLGFSERDPGPALEPGLAVELAQTLVARLVVQDPRGEPTLVVIENAHHFPQVSRALLTYLQERIAGSAVGLLVTERTRTSADADGDIRGGSTQELAELPEADATTLIEDAWRQAGGGSPPPWLAQTVYRQAGGNPLFLRTAALRMRSRWRPGDPPPTEDPAGDDSLTGVLTERIDLLDAGQRQVLAVLAVARRPCRLTTTVELLSGRIDSTSVQRAVQLLQDGNYVRPLTDGDRYRIRHDLLRHVVYEQMSHAERVRIHRALSELLSRQGASPGEIADHVRHLDDPNLGRTWYPLAGAEARRSWNVPSAIEWWRMARPLLEGRDRVEAEVELLELLLVGGRAADVLEQVDTQPVGTSLEYRAGDGDIDDDLLVRRRLAVAEAALACGAFDRCEAQCSVVMELTEGRDEARHQRASELLVRSLCDRGNMSEAVSIARTQLARAERTTDTRSLTTANASLGAALLMSGDPSAAAHHYEAALQGAHATGDVIHQIHVLSDLAGCAYAADDYPRCLDLLGQARALAETVGYRHHLMYSLSNEAQLRAGLGDPHAGSCAQMAIQRGLELGDLAVAANALHTWLTSDVQLMADLDAWRRLAAVDEHLGRTLNAAEEYANVAVAAARKGDARFVEDASLKVMPHPDVTPGSELDRRLELASTLLAAQSLPEGSDSDRLALAQELETLTTLPDVSELESAELRVAAWSIVPDDAHQARAVAALQDAFTAEPSAIVRAWFDELGVEPPPDRHRLPPPIGITGEASPAELDAALSALEAALDSRTEQQLQSSPFQP
jgi:class 3 adenylate cyclase